MKVLQLLLLLLLGTHTFGINVTTLTENNFVTLRGPVDSMSSDKVITELMKCEGPDIYLYLDTPGGSVIDGYRIIQTMWALETQGKKIHGVAKTAISMGFVIFQACTERHVTEGAIIMQHQMKSGARGDIEAMNSQLEMFNRLYNETCQMQADRIGIELDDFLNRVRSEWWLTTESSMEQNVSDDLIHILCSPEIMDKTDEMIVDTMFGRYKISYPMCPLLSDPISYEPV